MNYMDTKTLTIILERGDGELWGRIETPGCLLTTVGNSTNEVTANLRDLVADFLQHEGHQMATWAGISEPEITYVYEYDLTAFFGVFQALKINAIADASGINQSLMRQYASGKKRPSERQARKIEIALRQLGSQLSHVSLA